jgi:L-threonine kinase
VILRVPGSCGELVQGSIKGQDFLVSCPINLYTKVKAKLVDSTLEENRVLVNKKAPKTKAAVKKLLQFYNYKTGVELEIDSELKKGIGMASSTADISAATAAVMLLLNKKIDFELLKDICLSLEPTDSVFLDGIRFFDHRQGKKNYFIAEAPEIDILIFKERGSIDSINFNQSKKLSTLNNLKTLEVKKALNFVVKGLRCKDYYLLARGSTISSLAHQNILFKKNLDKLLKIINSQAEVYGLNIAHSGTLIGVLVNRNLKFGNLVGKIKKETELKYLNRVQMISGGIERKIVNGSSTSTWRKIGGGGCKKQFKA